MQRKYYIKCIDCGTPVTSASTRCHKCAGKKHPKYRPILHGNAIKTMLANGYTQSAIARLLGLSRQRISQVIKKGD